MKNTIALAGYGVDLKTSPKKEIGKFVAELAQVAGILPDVVSSGIIGLPGHVGRKFRKTAAAMEYLMATDFQTGLVGATQRAAVKGEWDVASTKFQEDIHLANSIFSGGPILRDLRIADLISVLVSANAHYVYGLNVESHLYGVCFLGGTRLSSKMSESMSRNMAILQNSIFDGERFFDRIFDVFPINVLSSRHLAARIGGRNLESLITSNGWGSLEALAADRWLWRMSDDKIAQARAVLLGSDFMLAAN